jgi:seryl-tRNA synthetase
MQLRLNFETAIPPELVAELEKGAVYATAALERLRVTPDLRAAVIDCADGAEAEVTAKVKKWVDAMVTTFRSLGEPEALGQRARRDTGPLVPDAYEALVERKWLKPLGRGQVGFAGAALALKRHLDEAARDLACTRFAAAEEDYPALLEPEVLARTGYASSFPQSVCLVSRLREDFDAIEAFRGANTGSDALRVPDLGALAHADAALRPAVCLPIYRALADTRVDDAGLTITTTGKAFRYESKNVEGIQRLWDFSMREIVFVGSAEFIEERRARAVEAVAALLEAWDLGYRLVAASDPFFATVRGTKALWQRSRALKHEVMVDLGTSTLAVGSINVAGTLFGHAFGITTPRGEAASTACVGFGLERLVLALFTQHGFEPARWPRALREVVFG